MKKLDLSKFGITYEEFADLSAARRRLLTIYILLQFAAVTMGLIVLMNLYSGYANGLIWFASIIYLGFVLQSLSLPERTWTACIYVLAMPLELLVLTVFFGFPWEFFFIEFLFVHVGGMVAGMSVGSLLWQPGIPFLQRLSGIVLLGLLAAAIGAGFTRILIRIYGFSLNPWWLLLLIPFAQATANNSGWFFSGKRRIIRGLKPSYDVIMTIWIVGCIFAGITSGFVRMLCKGNG